jgi:hypothetical protein
MVVSPATWCRANFRDAVVRPAVTSTKSLRLRTCRKKGRAAHNAVMAKE